MSLALEPQSVAGRRTAVGVLDRAVAILEAVERGARTLPDVVRSTGYSRSTAHRLLQAMEAHGLLSYTGARGYHLGPRLLHLADRALSELPLRELAHPSLVRLARSTGETAQLFVRSLDERICVDTAESSSELRTIVPLGAALPLSKGSAAKIFLGWTSADDRDRLLEDVPPADAARLRQQVATARRRGWADSVAEREPGVGSVSAPVVGPYDALVAVVSVSGPVSRLGRAGARRYAAAVVAAAREIEAALGLRDAEAYQA